MPRRSVEYKVNKNNRIQREYSKGNGDKLYSVFQCLNPDCESLIVVESSKILDDQRKIKPIFSIRCPDCGYSYHNGGTEKFYEYSLDEKESINDNEETTWEQLETGDFLVRHEDYLQKAKDYKYCIVCSTLQPLENFSIHNSRKSKRQGECITCKNTYNAIKNKTRTPEQFAESSQKRRLYSELAGNQKINVKKIRNKFDNRCFNCGKDLSDPETVSNLDHTLPAMYLWPLDTHNATLLCSECNQNKSGLWPGKFYDDKKLHALSILTGIEFEILNGRSFYNPQSIEKLHNKEVVENIVKNYAKHMDEIIKLRNRIIRDTSFDFFQSTDIISKTWLDKANSLL